MVPSAAEDWYNVKLWFHDAMYYTPMVYDYFTTFMAQSATPALSDAYDDVYTRATRAPEETIIDKNEKGEWTEKNIHAIGIMIDVIKRSEWRHSIKYLIHGEIMKASHIGLTLILANDSN